MTAPCKSKIPTLTLSVPASIPITKLPRIFWRGWKFEHSEAANEAGYNAVQERVRAPTKIIAIIAIWKLSFMTKTRCYQFTIFRSGRLGTLKQAQKDDELMALRMLGTASRIAAAAVAGGSAFVLTASVAHSSDSLHPTAYPWSHNGIFSAYDAGRFVNEFCA
jgi:hypothetical protein